MVPSHWLGLLQGISYRLRGSANYYLRHLNNFIINIMKKIEIEIPEGKEVQWVGDTLKLVDIKKSITERIKTFEDACKELGNHPFVREYALINPFTNSYSSDIVAYLKLRIIVAALNEGWEPKFEEGEPRYYPWFYLCTKKEYNKLDDKEKVNYVLYSNSNTNAYYVFISVNAYHDVSCSCAHIGSRLAFKTKELAEYAGKQFIDIYADFYL